MQRSAKLKALLHYLCHRAWSEGAEEIAEYDIGIHVFGRPEGFDPAQDTLVRVQASQLRKRLERYFLDEGHDEPLELTVARGTYVPSLRERAKVTASCSQTEHTEPRYWRRVALGLGVLSALLAVLSVTLLLNREANRRSGTATKRFWSDFGANEQETFIVTADASIAAFQDGIGRHIGLDEYLSRGYRKELERTDFDQRYRFMMSYLLDRRYTSLPDVLIVRRLTDAQLLDSKRTTVVFARDHQLRAFQSANHILIGSERSNPWVGMFRDSMDFQIADDLEHRRMVVINRRPRPGEPARFEPDVMQPVGADGFSLLACLPNQGRTGHVLILAGAEMSGTEAAGKLVTSEAFFDDLWRRLPRSEGRPPYFEAVLRTRNVEMTNASFQVVALHAH